MALPEKINQLLPPGAQWIDEQVVRIQKEGVDLTADQQIDAHLAGVKHPGRVKLLFVDEIPFPSSPVIVSVLNDIGLLTMSSIGLSLGYGIFIQKHHRNNRRVIVHELTHTAQYERLGGTAGFLQKYLEECVEHGYHFAPLEIEAKENEKKICGK